MNCIQIDFDCYFTFFFFFFKPVQFYTTQDENLRLFYQISRGDFSFTFEKITNLAACYDTKSVDQL